MELFDARTFALLPALHSTEGIDLDNRIVICRFYLEYGNWEWFVFEGERTEDGDYRFFGVIRTETEEVGYFLLSDISRIRGPNNTRVRIDEWIFRKPYFLIKH